MDCFWCTIETCWSDILVFISSYFSINIQGREPCLGDLEKISVFDVGLPLNIYGPISVKVSLVIDNCTLHFAPAWMTMAFTQGHICTRKKNLPCSFSHRFFFLSVSIKFSVLLLIFLGSCCIYFTGPIFKGKTLLRCVLKNMFKITLGSDACKPISCLLDMMINVTKHYSLIQVLMTMAFTQGHRIVRKLEHVQSLCCYVAWSDSDFCNEGLCKGDSCKEASWVWWIWITWMFSLV